MNKKIIYVFATVVITFAVGTGILWNVIFNSPVKDFERETGFNVSESMKILSSDDTHGGFLGDGEFYVIFQADAKVVSEYINSKPPWDNNKWLKGPIDPFILQHCSFGRGLGRFSNPKEVFYVARNRGPAELPWHNGDLFFIDPDNNSVWYSRWDF